MSTDANYDVIVIGGGASGMLAAGRAAERGLKVLLVEKNLKLGEKLRITGGGRCNITNAEENERILLRNYGKAEQFLYSLFAQFGVSDTFDFFESRGMKLVVEARKRAFPASHDASDVVKLLERYVKEHGVTVLANTPIKKILAQNGHIEAVESKSATFRATDYIFATGSVSRPETGSTGDGFDWLHALGHSVVAPTPDIVPLATADSWSKLIAGVTLLGVKITFFAEEAKQFSLKGDILCTHFGLSGPLILNSAHQVADLMQSGRVSAEIDLFPSTDLGALERTVLEVFDANKNKSFKNVVAALVPAGAQRGVLELVASIIDVETKVHSISKVHRKLIAKLLKSMPVEIDGLMGFDKAVIADGGLDLTEVDFKTMRSKKISNLYVTGDLLHINRPSGGYSLQLCWSSGYVAGSSVGEK